jgi:general secretion pathway protein E
MPKMGQLDTSIAQAEQAAGSDLVSLLKSRGVLTDESAERAERALARTGGSLVDILVRLGLCEEKALAESVAALTGLPIFKDALPEEPVRAGTISVPFLREARVLPLAESDTSVTLASADPTDVFATRALQLAFGKKVNFVVAPASLIEDGIARLYAPAKAVPGIASDSAFDITSNDIARLRESASEAPIVRFVERLIARAVDAGASDIHIEPFERQLRVRLRVDGMLAEEEPAALSSAPAIVSRIKILAKLDIAERRLPQDGSIKLNVRGREIDFRVATTPVVHGETVVIRILDRTTVRLDLTDLGFDDALLTRWKTVLDRPNGILLVTGPTGSGKSTTLYAALSRLNRPERKVITVEDPVEFKIDGLNQIQVKPDIGLDFARTLRAMLRHDPDVIMVGEIRDGETARIAMQASLTGHLVLSTLHTNDAASAVTRLLDMGIEDYLVSSTVSAVMAQRLVRSLCTACRKPVAVPEPLQAAAEARRARGLSCDLHEAVGCPACRGTGYRGRTVIAELIIVDEKVRRAILSHAEASQVRASAVESGMETLFENGLARAFAGVTSYDEVLRVAQDVGEST